MKPNRFQIIVLLYFLLLQLTLGAQNKNFEVQQAESFMASNADSISEKGVSITKNSLIGAVITSKTSATEKIYFVNNKYYVKIKNNKKTLGVYKWISIREISLIVLLNKNRKRVEGFVAKKNTADYWVNWSDYGFTDLETYSKIEQVNTDDILPLDDVAIDEINFHHPDVSFYVKSGKVGMQSKGRNIIKNECDSLSIYGDLATIFNAGKPSIFNLKGKLLLQNAKAVYPYSTTYNQVIDSQNNMYFVDTLGIKYDVPVDKRWVMGNNSGSNRIVTYYSYENKILKISIAPEGKNDDNQLSNVLNASDKDTNKLDEDYWEHFLEMKKYEELLFLKQVYKKNEIEYFDKLSYYMRENIQNEFIELPRDYKKIRFVNNSTITISAKDYWYDVDFYKRLDPSYLIVKRRRKYGVWDLEKQQTIVSFSYKKITPKEGRYLRLEKDGLYSHYP